MSLVDFKVVSFESRRAELVESLIRQHGGQCFNAPSVREQPIERDEECLRFVEDVTRGDYETVVFTAGVGVQYLIDAASKETRLENLHTPHKVKMAVVGCPRNCAEATAKDIGLVGQKAEVVVGGAAGKGVRKADLLITVETTEMALGIRGGLLSVLSRETPATWNALTTLWSAWGLKRSARKRIRA